MGGIEVEDVFGEIAGDRLATLLSEVGEKGIGIQLKLVDQDDRSLKFSSLTARAALGSLASFYCTTSALSDLLSGYNISFLIKNRNGCSPI